VKREVVDSGSGKDCLPLPWKEKIGTERSRKKHTRRSVKNYRGPVKTKRGEAVDEKSFSEDRPCLEDRREKNPKEPLSERKKGAD